MEQTELAELAAFGLGKMIEELQRKLAEVNAIRAAPVNGHKRRQGRPPKALLEAVKEAQPTPSPRRFGWPEDPEERKKEMARRRAKWADSQADATLAEKKADLSKLRSNQWATLSKKKRAHVVAAMTEGRRKAREIRLQQTPTVKLEA